MSRVIGASTILAGMLLITLAIIGAVHGQICDDPCRLPADPFRDVSAPDSGLAYIEALSAGEYFQASMTSSDLTRELNAALASHCDSPLMAIQARIAPEYISIQTCLRDAALIPIYIGLKLAVSVENGELHLSCDHLQVGPIPMPRQVRTGMSRQLRTMLQFVAQNASIEALTLRDGSLFLVGRRR